MKIILVFGTSGCGKQEFLEKLNNPDQQIWTTELEKEWEQYSGRRWISLLENPAGERRDALEKATSHLAKKISALKKKTKDSGTYLVGVHGTHFVEGILSSPLPLSSLRNLNIASCFTVFDDLYAMHRRLIDKHGYHYGYQQLLAWRNAELVVADLASTILAPKSGNIWLGVKHPLSCVRNALLENPCPRVYAAFSISGIVAATTPEEMRNQLVQETNEYRARLHQKDLTVFDPATLDDRILINDIMEDASPRGTEIEIPQVKRWPFAISNDPANSPRPTQHIPHSS